MRSHLVREKNRRSRNRQRGASEILLALILSGIAAAGILAYFNYASLLVKDYAANLDSQSRLIEDESAIETFLLAYRAAERSYLRQISGCDSAFPFLYALRSGTGCPTTVTLFSKSVDAADASEMRDLYSYTGNGCTLSAASSSCGDLNHFLISIGEESEVQRINLRQYRISMVRPWPELGAVEFLMAGNRGRTGNSIRFLVRGYFENSAHVETNGRVVQESPIPFTRCAGTPWADYRSYDPVSKTCRSFVQVGGGNGLAFYNDRFFGFRSSDGLIIDMEGAWSSSSYIVNFSNGTLPGLVDPVFVPYPNPVVGTQSLMGIDDITIVGTQIYYVAGPTGGAVIGYAAPNGTRQKICDLAAQSWAQAFAGIAATNWSDPLVPGSTDPLDPYLTNRTATFFLKSDGGDFITAFVAEKSGGFDCFVAKDPTRQQVEYLRTDGFDRAVDSKPFYTF